MAVAGGRNLKWLGYAAIISITVLAAAFLILSYIYTGNTIRKGIVIENTDVSWLSAKDARQLVSQKLVSDYSNRELILTYGSSEWKVPLKDIGYGFLVDDAVQQAFQIGRKGNIFKNLFDSMTLLRNGQHLEAEETYDPEKLRMILQQIKKQCDSTAQDAEMTYKNGKISFKREKLYRNLDIDTNMKLVENHLVKRDFSNIELIAEEKEPRITYEEIKVIDSVISSYTTSFNRNDVNRTDNIKLACSRIDNKILLPGEEFSMNEELGPRTLANGYKQAPIIFKNELVPGTGGGVCQVSSTLYNTVLLAGLKVTEREHHSMTLSYISPGRDATITEDSIDFKFVNDLDHPVAISAQVSGNKLIIRILGRKRDDGIEIKLKTKTIGVYKPKPEQIIQDTTLQPGQKIVEREPRNGLRVVLYREAYRNGVLQWREKLNEDYYRPIQGIVKVSSDLYQQYKLREQVPASSQ